MAVILPKVDLLLLPVLLPDNQPTDARVPHPSRNGEPHHLRRRANQRDYAARMAEFFGYELKAGPKPNWMDSTGIPYLHTAEQAAP